MNRRQFMAGVGAAATIPAGCNIFGNDSDDDGNDGQSPYPIERTVLGKTGIEVSRLSFGSHLNDQLIADPDTRDSMIRSGYEGGINLFDVYDHGGYAQFKPMGESVKDFRKDVAISLCAVNGTSELEDEIDGALNDFHTDYIDLYRLYSVNDDRMDIMVRAKEAGKARSIGLVGHDVGTLNRYLDDYGSTVDYVMLIFNFHHNKALVLSGHKSRSFTNDYAALMPRLEELGLGIIGIKPMGSDAMVELARSRGFFDRENVNTAQAMIRYVLAVSEIDTTMMAMNSMDELQTNLQAAYNPAISPDEEALLEELSETASSTERAYLPDHYRWLEDWSVRTV